MFIDLELKSKLQQNSHSMENNCDRTLASEDTVSQIAAVWTGLLQNVNDLKRQHAAVVKRIKDQKYQNTKTEAKLAAISALLSSTGQLGSRNVSEKSTKVKDKLSLQIAENITAIVGLKEAITWRCKTLKWIWACALFVGICITGYFVCAATTEYFDYPTATKMELVRQETYEYPLFALCPNKWWDDRKTSSLGLSSDAIQYSFGYHYPYDEPIVKNLTAAKQEFLSVYNKNNFSSLEQYYQRIALDIEATRSTQRFVSAQNSISICFGCVDELPPKKIFLYNTMCYVFNLTPENADYSVAPNQKLMAIKSLSDVNQWRLHIVDKNLSLKSILGPATYLPAFVWKILKIDVKRYIKLEKKDGSCVAKKAAYVDHINCQADCTRDISRLIFKCYRFMRSGLDFLRQDPSEHCNFFDYSSAMNLWEQSDWLAKRNLEVSNSRIGIECRRKCPRECDRLGYEISLMSQYDEVSMPSPLRDIVTHAKRSNMSVLAVEIEHGSAKEEGIWTMKEIETISLATLISNVGGALGLFVGGTMMTFMQMILFMFKYAMDKRAEPNVVLQQYSVHG